MRTQRLASATLWRGTAACAAFLAAAALRAEPASSLAQTIAYETAGPILAEASSLGPAADGPSADSAFYAPALSLDGGDAAVEAASAAAPCASCGGGGSGVGAYPYNRCGCSEHALFPWFTGPGACDDWCVGPHWQVAVDGLILFREGIDWASIPAPGFTQEVSDDFDYGPGARLFVTGYNENRFGLQVGYEGVNDFHANALFSNVAGDERRITYESNINSLEVNVIRRTSTPWRPFAGVRYIELDDDLVDFTTVDRPVPAPADPPAGPAAFIDAGTSVFLDNRMIGMQGGAFRDMWRLNQWVTIEPFGNAGVYFNDFKREDITRTVTTVVRGDDISTPANEFSTVTTEVRDRTVQEFSELAFVGEAGVTSVLRLNRCLALRGGYQVLAVNGVGTAIDSFLAPGFNPTTLVYHGGHFGIEYVR
ncbi:MAG TPA: hypothetical protein VEQ85_04560 [Lacipirellulaceae bacterium]|nr:hypothetical protein [Lacipirellulaceae bacterium]